jgi:general secretion pathway protein M
MKRIREWYDGLAERERRLIIAFGVVLAAFAFFLIPLASSSMLDGKREEIKALRNALDTVQNSREKFAERKARRDAIAARYATKAPALAGFLENAARQSKLEIPESQDRADLPHGKKFTERSTVVRLRKVSMLPLVKMLEKIETADLPVTVSRINVRKRGGETDSYDVELGVSAFDSNATAAPGTATTGTVATTANAPKPTASGATP